MTLESIASLIKEIRETGEFLLKLPSTLAVMWADVRIARMNRKERIEALKELIYLREIGKQLQTLYFWKGDLVAFAKSIGPGQDPEEVGWIKDSFAQMSVGLNHVAETIHQATFSNTALATEALLFLSRASLAYKKLSELPDAALTNGALLGEVCAYMEKLNQEATGFIARLDTHRLNLDYTYS